MADGGYSALAGEARRVLANNRLRGTSLWDGRQYNYVCPSPEKYPFQWLWDSAFHAIALLHVNPELAKQELRCILQGLQPDGFLPHMVLWDKENQAAALASYSIVLGGDYFTATTQPPVIARALARVYQATQDKAFLAETLPQVIRWFDWLASVRDPDGDGLISIIQPDESGMDTSPKWDALLGITTSSRPLQNDLKTAMGRLFDSYEPLRGNAKQLAQEASFSVEDVMVNAIYGDGLRCLAELCRGAGDYRTDILTERASRVTKALMAKCWDDTSGLFWDIRGSEEEPLHLATVSSLFPLILADLDAGVSRRLVEDHLLNPAEFWTRYPVPSVAADEPSFDPDFKTGAIWRGPTWVNTNWYLYWGLRIHGFGEVASELANRTLDMVARGGTREFYQPFTGAGNGAADFGWSSLVLDLMAAEGKLPR